MLVATFALEAVDAFREWPTTRPAITADECLTLCGWSGVGVHVWTYEGCTCATPGGQDTGL